MSVTILINQQCSLHALLIIVMSDRVIEKIFQSGMYRNSAMRKNIVNSSKNLALRLY